MTDPEVEPELQATADLSPVSPSPVHASAIHVVPTLQDTADTIDAMVAAVTAPLPVDEIMADVLTMDESSDIRDDESFNDAYGESVGTDKAVSTSAQEDQPDGIDDYAKSFDSPIDPDEVSGKVDSQPIPPNPQGSSTSSSSSSVSSQLTSGPHETISPALQIPISNGNASVAERSESHLEVTSTPSESKELASEELAKLAASQSLPPQLSVASDQSAIDSAAAEIQQLVADITAKSDDSDSSPDIAASPAKLATPEVSVPQPIALPSSSSLPPRPPIPNSSSQSYPSHHHPSGSSSAMPPANAVGQVGPVQQAPFIAAGGAPGTSTEPIGAYPTPPAPGFQMPQTITSMNPPSYQGQAPGFGIGQSHESQQQRDWDQFLADERQYMSEAKWDRFPEGSRIFIGNLSSDKVSKRDVFEMFHRFGRLAQISLKSAYGFVQYHTADEGRRAMDNLQGIEIKGRRVHLEISRVQDKSKKERGRSPERPVGRAAERGTDRGTDRERGRENGRRNDRNEKQDRDEWRSSRDQSPSRNDYRNRDDGYGRDRGSYGGGNGRHGRSRSPVNDRKDSYRRRSLSPYGRSRQDDELDLPRRYGSDVPDVQVILQPDVNRDFVSWVENAFKAKGLRTEVMYLHPRIPKDQIIQRQAAEGVHAVIDLDLRAQHLGKIPVQAFDRSGGTNSVRFDQYVDLDPPTAAEVVLRAKASGAPRFTPQPSYGNPTGYIPNYGIPPQQSPHQNTGYQMPDQHKPYHQPQQQQQQIQPSTTANLTSLLGQVDNNTLQGLLASIQGSAQGQKPGPHLGGTNTAANASNSQLDVQAILGSLGHNPAALQQATQAQNPYGGHYGGGGVVPSNAAPQQGQRGDSAMQVQNIMAQLARFRQ